MKTTAKELLKAIKEHIAIEKERRRMVNSYSTGTCNAEDAWSDFADREEKSIVNLKRLAKCKLKDVVVDKDFAMPEYIEPQSFIGE